MNRAHVNVDRVEQQRRSVRVRVEPAFERDLLEVFRLAGAWLDLGTVHVLDVSLLPVMRFSTDRGQIESKSRFEIRRVVETADERIDGDVDSAFDVAVAS